MALSNFEANDINFLNSNIIFEDYSSNFSSRADFAYKVKKQEGKSKENSGWILFSEPTPLK